MNRNFPKCSVSGCNQHATRDGDVCGTHRRERAEREAQHSDAVDLHVAIDDAETIEDLKQVLRTLANLSGYTL